MQRKFAVLDYMKTMDEVPLKLNMLKKSPAKLLDWYVMKFNPFLLSETELLGAAGFLIKLPITKAAAEEDKDKAEDLVLRTLASLEDMGVEIAVFPSGYEKSKGDRIPTADGKALLPFFIAEAVEKAVKLLGKSMATAEILIIGAAAETEALIHSLYADVNYLSVMVEEPEIFEETAAEIFEESGLNIQLFNFNKSALASADIIMNLVPSEAGYDYAFKRAAVYFDFSFNSRRLNELIRKRGDMLVIDGFRLRHEDLYMPLETLETALYVISSEYRRLFGKQFDARDAHLAKEVKKQLLQLDIRFAGYLQKERSLGSLQFSEFLKKAGVSG